MNPDVRGILGGFGRDQLPRIHNAVAGQGLDEPPAPFLVDREPSKMLPSVPTVDESGLPGFENAGWFGFLVPAGTPNDIVDKIYRDTVKVLSDPETQATLAAQGMTAVGNAPDAFANAMNEKHDTSTACKNARRGVS